MLDLLSNYEWDRPLNLLSMGGDINIGIKDYLMYDGFSYRFVPIKNRMKSTEIGFADADDLYDKIKNVYTWDALKRTDYFVDYPVAQALPQNFILSFDANNTVLGTGLDVVVNGDAAKDENGAFINGYSDHYPTYIIIG